MLAQTTNLGFNVTTYLLAQRGDMSKSLTIIISGPRGSGKSSVAKGSNLALAQSWTTREPKDRDRPGEYFYVTRTEFEAGWEAGVLLERDEHFGNLYGLCAVAEDSVRITDIDVNGALCLKDRPDVLLVGVLPPEPIRLVVEDRLRKRGDETEAELQDSLDRVDYEVEQIRAHWPYIIINDDLDAAQQQLRVIIRNACKRRGIQHPY